MNQPQAQPPKSNKGCVCAVIALALIGCCGATIAIGILNAPPKGQTADGTKFQVTAETPGADATSLALILDTSGSMNETCGNSTKIAVAQEVLTEDFLPALADELYLSAYEFEGSSARELSPLRRNASQDAPKWLHREAVMGLIENTNANQGTPIAGSLRKVRGILASVAGRKLIVLVTDGEEGYETKESVVSEVRACNDAKIEVYVVGFNLGTEGGYLMDALGLGKHYFQANGGREELLKAMSSIAAALEK